MPKNLLQIVKDLESRVSKLETGIDIRNLTMPATGTLVIPVYAADPGTAVNGQVYYSSSLGKFRKYQAGAWKNFETA